MLLVNEKLPNFKMHIGQGIVSTDEFGQIEVKEKDAIEALLASGFLEKKGAKSAPKVVAKPAAQKEEKKSEQKVEVKAEEKVETKPVAEPKAESKKPHWKSDKNK